MCFLAGFAPTFAQDDGPVLQGFYRFYAGAYLNDEADFIVARNRVRLNLIYQTNRGRIYLSHDLRQNFRVLDDGSANLQYDLREAFIDAYIGAFDIRLGLQQIVWGEADGVFVTDLLSPLDLSEFLTQDFSDIRLGIPALKTIYYAGSVEITGVLTLRPLPSRLPEPGSPWDPIPASVPGLPITVDEAELPDFSIKNGELALKLSTDAVSRTTLSAIYLSAWNRLPVFRRRLSMDAPDQFRVRVTPTHFRRHVVGLAFETVIFDPFVLRGEAAVQSRFLHDQRTAVDVLNRPEEDLLRAAPLGQAVLGVERRFGQQVFRVQGIGSYIFNHNDRFVQAQFTPAATALWLGRFRRETLTVQTFAFVAHNGGYWINPSLTYNVFDGLNASLGAQFFGGEPELLSASTFSFGLYDANDFAYLKVQFDF